MWQPSGIHTPKPPKTVTERFVSKLVHEIVLSLIGNLTDDELRYIINNSGDITKQLGVAPDNPMVRKLLGIIKKWKNDGVEYLTTDNILYQCWDHRPDLFPVLNTPEGRKFIEEKLITLVSILEK